MIGAGRLRTLLSLQNPTQVRGSDGGFSISWQTVMQLWAEIVPLSSRERLLAKQALAETTHRITIWFTEGLTPDMRLVHGDGRVFNILGVFDKDELRREMVIDAKEERVVPSVVVNDNSEAVVNDDGTLVTN